MHSEQIICQIMHSKKLLFGKTAQHLQQNDYVLLSLKPDENCHTAFLTVILTRIIIPL